VKKHPLQAQYVVPLAYRIRWQMTLNLREAFHFCELRSARQGHIDYRRVAQGMFREIWRVHPGFSKHMRFMDMEDYGFERLEAEKRLDKKIEEMSKPHGKG
jgi:thymidylate synthase ThyX